MHTQLLPSDLWTDVFSFLPTPDLCVPCFTSKALRDAAVKTINSRLPNHRNWWRHKKQLPAYSRELVTWWISNIREPTWQEARDAAQRDDVDVIDLIGWDNTHASPRHRHLSRPGWCRSTLLLEAIASGSKRMINACHQRGDISQTFSTADQCFEPMQLWRKLGEEGNLDMMRWICNEQTVDGLPSVTWPEHVSGGSHSCMRSAAKAGHVHVILWLKGRGDIDEYTAEELYKGAAEGGRSDVLTWLRDHEIRFDVTREAITLPAFAGSLDLFEWALRHDIPNVGYASLYSLALNSGCTEPDVHLDHENYEAIQLSIDHGYLTRQSQILFKSTNPQLELIKWLHERDALPHNFYRSAIQYDHLDVLQWAVETGCLTGTDFDDRIYDNGSAETMEWLMKIFGTEETKMYRSLASNVRKEYITKIEYRPEERVTHWNIEYLEWMLQRKWKKSEEEVQRWFQREEEDITEEWLAYLWEHGIEP
ncbi:hypothetical protein PROFUN_12846 [Planoprotostelium fungivorum]|uniref:F-box domain-containing protein n=1 Tax=Planoprotostelium fungivorum TaxID=1890364 RepID=A0A2P6N6K4_9EUKA|nr:hypothetical protein PROFUN_12846 [Planoprotostelium fungivorum]